MVGSLTRGELRLDVHPLYRDGALLVAPFEIENTNKEMFVVPVPQPFSAVFAHEYVAMSPFSAITLVDEATKARYFGTRTSESHFLQNGVTTIPPAPRSAVTSTSLRRRKALRRLILRREGSRDGEKTCRFSR